MQIKVVLGPELIEKLNTAAWWAGLQTGALWMAIGLVIVFLVLHPSGNKS